MINSAIDSIIRNEIFFSLKHIASKEGKFISILHEIQIVPRNKRKKKTKLVELESRIATQGIPKEHVIVNIFLNVSNKFSWATLSLKKNLL